MLPFMLKRVWANTGLCLLESGRWSFAANRRTDFMWRDASLATRKSWNATRCRDCASALPTSSAESRAILCPLHIFACPGIDFNLLTGLNEQRGLNGDTGLQSDRLLDIVGRISPDAFRRIGNLQHDAGGQFDGDSLVFDKCNCNWRILDQ